MNALLHSKAGLLVLLVIVGAAAGRHLAAGSIRELEGNLALYLENIALHYGFDAGEMPTLGDLDFGDLNFDRVNFDREMRRARNRLDKAQTTLNQTVTTIETGDPVCGAMEQLYRSVRALDEATRLSTAANATGFGIFSYSLAVFSTVQAESFLEDLIVLAPSGISSAGGSTTESLAGNALRKAEKYKRKGDNFTTTNAGEWAPAVRQYKRGTCLLYKFL